MKILSINAGSSTLKFKMLEMTDESVICSGIFERIGSKNATYSFKSNDLEVTGETAILNHEESVKKLIELLISTHVLNSLEEIAGIGHRVVHGGEIYKGSVIFDKSVEQNILDLSALSPLHNKANLIGYQSFKKLLPGVLQVAVFDTAFHQSMSKENFLYAIPYEFYQDYHVRRYGFHGTSHQFVANTVSKLLNREDLKIISCHLGSGASITAIDSGKSISTSMGFTPLAGVIMGTRSGDIDPAIITYLAEKMKTSAEEIIEILNKKSGLLGVSQLSNDARDIQKGINDGQELALIAQKMYINSILERIGSYYVKLGGLDVIIFTAGVGENDFTIRKEVIHQLSKVMPIKLDEVANLNRAKTTLISTADSKIKAYIIPTNEELMIARDVVLIGGLK